MKLIRQRESLGAQQDYQAGDNILRAVRSGAAGPVLRIYQPRPTVAFGRRDELLPGFAAAERAVQRAGFTPLVRKVGGRAAAYHRGCLVIDHIEPDPDPKAGIQERYRLFADMVVAAMEELDVPAEVGEIPGEYCPGEHSVHATGRTISSASETIKLAGSAQRIVQGAWYFSTVVVVEQAEPLRSVLTDVYRCLGLQWSPSTAGAVEDLRPGTRVSDVEAALRKVYGMYARHMGHGSLQEQAF
ncbi:lipoate--protein ligase family protein [Kocuria sp. ZOR0020]|uniref:lipoate--protein ligase family protein n=1 Tax=Kocuria sp. ZOR0020 TaxID=1339234 RepID=UPI000647C942|nr:lipoate--protein ligase family protein [Kocuria sp. ZOR0020]